MTTETLDIIRINIGDIDTDSPTFTDAQITATYTKLNSNENLTSARLLRSLASMAGQKASVSMGKISESSNANALIEQAKAFEALAIADGIDLAGNESAFDMVVETGNSEFAITEILTNNAIRDSNNE